MKILYYECFAGISGDMNLGAMIDLGVDENHLIKELKKLSIANEFDVKIKKGDKMGITGTKVDVDLKHDHDHHHHHHHHDHRNLNDINKIINESDLSDRVKNTASKIFHVIAQAEAKVHGKTIEEIHFHEVGAVDSIVDVVGASICFDYLNVDKIMCSTVELGGGFVKCAHGVIPVPAPATIEILQGVPTHKGRIDREATTPTGAAILKTLVDTFTDDISFNIIKTGYGLGTMDFSIPNVLRASLAEYDDKDTKYLTDENILIETNIDDMNPETMAYIEEKLLANGALDVYRTSIVMKKGRMAVKLSVLAKSESLSAIENILLHETTTFGIRSSKVVKKMFDRKMENVDTKYGQVPVKVAIFNGKPVKYKAEYDVVKKLAVKNGVSMEEIYREIQKEKIL